MQLNSVQLDHVLIGLLVVTVIMAGYAGSNLPKPSWLGKAVAVVIAVLVGLAIARIILAWSTTDTEPIAIEPLAENGAPVSMPRSLVVERDAEA